jgi:hypothetical protein
MRVTRSLGQDRTGPVALAAVLVAAIVFRLPALIHPSETNSDAAVVGLQAMHMLRGEWSPFLWGSGYQSSVDSGYAALVFALFGPSARALVASSLSLHLALIALAWVVLARRLDPLRAALCVLPLVFTSSPSQTYILYPPRQAALTLAILALWALDRAADGGRDLDPRRQAVFASAGAILGLSCFADPYAIVMVPPVAVFGLACAFRRDAPAVSAIRSAAFLTGGLAGSVPAVALRHAAGATHEQLSLSTAALGHNLMLLMNPCLAWLTGARAWTAPEHATEYVPWQGPAVARSALAAGGILFGVLLVVGGFLVFVRRVPWPVRRLALAGGLALPVTIGGFLVSPMVMDLFSSRYLAAIVIFAPFALAPFAALVTARDFSLALAPCVLASGVAGWLGYGPFLRGSQGHSLHPEEEQLGHALTARGVTLGMADYWTAYRLTFLTNEELVVVPANAGEDRYPPYRQRFDVAPAVAYVFDPVRSREAPDWIDQELATGKTGFSKDDVEIVHAGRFRAVILHREAPAAPAH